jgi:hypothetical protein
MMHFTAAANMRFWCAAGALLGLASFDARAVPVLPGGAAVLLPGTSEVARPELAGVVLADTVANWQSAVDPRYGFPGAEGTLHSLVVRSALTGTLDFYWQIEASFPSYPVDIAKALTIDNIPLADFGTGSTFDVDYRLDGLGSVAPVNARASATSLIFDFHGFGGDSAIGPGRTTHLLLLHSTSTTYTTSAVATLAESELPTFAPAAVPEPETITLLLGGLGVIGVIARVRRSGLRRTLSQNPSGR